MKKGKKLLIISVVSLISLTTSAVVASKLFTNKDSLAYADDVNNYWNHYERVAPTLLKHGSKEFWANCSTFTYTLTQPSGTIREGVAFDSTPYFDDLDEDDPRFIPALKDKIDIKSHFNNLIAALTNDPYSFIPDTMRPSGVDKVTEQSVSYDFTNFVSVSNINYGGFGEQWHMVINNIKESERFYNVTTFGAQIIGAANAAVLVFLDENEDNNVSWEYTAESYRSKLVFTNGVLDYTIKFITGFNIPLFGEVVPQIDMKYVVSTETKTVRIQLGEGNALKFVITPDTYTFGLEYGVTQVSRAAYFTITKDEDEGTSEGHIYEYIQYQGEDKIKSCADFYIDETYTSVVGNKASGITGFTGYINELYKTDNGKLLGYKVKETFTKWGFEKTYNTLWFNLNNINNIINVKAISNGSIDPHENNHDVYLNNSASIFEPKKNKVAFVSTSRRYDVEMRKQYFYEVGNDELIEHEVKLPMMFIQDDGTESGETNYSTFEADISETNGINASVNLSSTYLNKIRADYLSLIPTFEQNKDNITGEDIATYIGTAVII